MRKVVWPLRWAVGLAWLVLAAAVVSRADSIYTNLGSGNSYDPLNEWDVSTLSSDNQEYEAIAVPFTPTSNYELGQILIALTNVDGTNQAYVTLNSDSGGLPGAVIASWNLTGLDAWSSTSTITPEQTLTAPSGIFLTAGTTYWIVAMPDSTGGTSDTWDAWEFNVTGDVGTFAYSDGTTWYPDPDVRPAFQVDPTPEPPTFTLLGLALAALPFFRRRLLGAGRDA